ncbi:MAG: hypothetical protein HC930_00200 [Hydrococcus sp. SU_1_0]|nr:hypothetical protein [Hydrococcus sp. SU_1_0]
MKIIIRWSSILFIFLATLLNIAKLENSKALALPQDVLVEKLDRITLYSIYDKKSGEQAKFKNSKIYFVSEEDAKKALADIHNENPESGDLAYIVEYSLEVVRGQDNFIYVPDQDEVNLAKAVGEANQSPYQGGVPLFVGKIDDNYIILTGDNSQEIIPFFFKKQHLDKLITRFKTENPELAESINVEVVSLESLVHVLETSEDPVVKKIQLIPYNSEF